MTYAQMSPSTADVAGSDKGDVSARRAAAAPAITRGPASPTATAGSERSRPAVASDDAWVRSQRVTVLMATFNRADLIGEALDSLLGQTRPPDEVIVVDDGSTDDTRARVQGFGGRVRYIGQHNGGKASAINRGLAAATGDWIWFFDDDDAALPDGLERLLYGLAKERDADFVYGGQMTGSSGVNGRIVPGRVVLPPDVPSSSLFGRGLRNIPFLLPAALVRRARIDALRGFDERYARSQDYEFLLRLLVDARGLRVPQPIFVWRSHDGPRGPQHVRHDVALRERVWMEAGGMLGRDLRRRLPLASYLPRLANPADGAPLAKARTALIQRMAIMASKGLVREMVVDLRSAANLPFDGPNEALDRDEALACWEVGNFPFFQMRLLDAPDRVVTRLAAAMENRTGKAIVARIARGILHAARLPDRSTRERRVLARCALRLFLACGPLGALRAYLPAPAR